MMSTLKMIIISPILSHFYKHLFKQTVLSRGWFSLKSDLIQKSNFDFLANRIRIWRGNTVHSLCIRVITHATVLPLHTLDLIKQIRWSRKPDFFIFIWAEAKVLDPDVFWDNSTSYGLTHLNLTLRFWRKENLHVW